MDWVKKTDSAGRSGINDYINAPQRVSSRQVRAKIGSLEEIVTSKIEGEATTDIKNNYGVFDKTLNVLANRTLFYNLNSMDKPLNIQIEDTGEVSISNHTDSSGNADKNKALQFDQCGNIILNGNIVARNNIDNSGKNYGPYSGGSGGVHSNEGSGVGGSKNSQGMTSAQHGAFRMARGGLASIL